MEYYPEQLRWVAALCEALTEFDKNNTDINTHMIIKNRVPLVDQHDSNIVMGYLVDEIGGVWSFLPVGPE
jgi:hypothetical protein